MATELFPRFSAAEFARRHAAVRALMAERGLNALVAYGNSGLSRHNHADIHYLSGFLGNRNNYVVQLRQGDPVLYVQSHNHVPNAREASRIPTEWGGADSAETVARHIVDAGLRRGAALTDAAVEHFIANVKPGMHEHELGALIEAAGLARGGLPLRYFVTA